MPEPATYEIVRFSRGTRPQRVMRTGLTLAEARDHCQDPASRGADWFDGFRNTDPDAQRAFVERDLRQFKALLSSGEMRPERNGFNARCVLLPDCED